VCAGAARKMAEEKKHLYHGPIGGKEEDQPVAERAKASGNVQLVPEAETKEVAEDSEEFAKMRKKQQELEAAMEKEKAQRDRALAVPTNDHAVKRKLRDFGEPAVLFGEDAYERRERLKGLIATKGDALAATAQAKKATVSSELFYTEGTPELQAARLEIARVSMQKSEERLRKEKKQRENEDVYSYEDRLKRAQAHIQKNLYSEVSQVGDVRPLSHCAFSPDPKTSYLATASWSGLVKLWTVPSAEVAWTLRGHDDRCQCVAWHPQACTPSAPKIQLASGSANSKILLWGLGGGEDDPMGEESGKVQTPLRSLEEHDERVNRVVFHPMGRHLLSTSHDMTWRMWDLETGSSLLLQEGHVHPVYAIAVHPDGSLVATSDTSGLTRLWDLRSGRTLLPLQGHVKQCLAVDFHPQGFTLATGSEDNAVKVWDLRKRKCVQTLCAHNKLVSTVKFEPEHGRYLLTSSFDQVCRIWSTLDYACTKSLAGHGARVMSADVSASSKYVATVAFDRTFKLWQYSDSDVKAE